MVQLTIGDTAPTWQILTPEADSGAAVTLYPDFIADDLAGRWMATLTEQIAWQQRTITLFGKTHLQPRLVAWYGDPGIRYRYSGQTMEPEPWLPLLTTIRERCIERVGTAFNSVLCNLYRDGQDAMGWHADNEPELGPTPVIASISLGCVRRFDLRHRQSRVTHQLLLPSGSLLVMAGTTQQHWVHQIARTRKIDSPRINLTFRQILARP